MERLDLESGHAIRRAVTVEAGVTQAKGILLITIAAYVVTL
jgi:hypothetical protein